MEKTYKIVDSTVTVDGTKIKKQNIEYYQDGVLQIVEFYSKDGIIDDEYEIKKGYKLVKK